MIICVIWILASIDKNKCKKAGNIKCVLVKTNKQANPPMKRKILTKIWE